MIYWGYVLVAFMAGLGLGIYLHEKLVNKRRA